MVEAKPRAVRSPGAPAKASLRAGFVSNGIGPGTGKISAAQLLTALQRLGFDGNLRAVQRDLAFLGKLLPDLQHDGERVGGLGWSWRKDAPVLDLPGLDPAMALTFVMARSLLQPLLPPILLDRLGPYFTAAEQVLSAAAAPGLAAWKDHVRVIPQGQPLRHAVIDPEVIAVVQTALLEGRRFKGRYQSRGRDPAEYDVNPLGLVFRDRVVYLVASLWDYSDLRHFALHRFERAEPLEREATVPDGFDLDAYIATGTFQYAATDARDIKLKLRMDADAAAHLVETPLSEDQRIRDDPAEAAWVEICATVLDTEQLVWWLLGFGDRVEVLAPAALRQRMVATVRGMGVRYGLG